MELKLNLSQESKNGTNKRMREAEAKVKDKNYQPTWNEIWLTGWTAHTGTVKKGIFQTKMSDLDKSRLNEVKVAIEDGVLGYGVEDMRKFTKAHALRLYKELVEIKREQTIAEMLANRPENYILVQDEKTLDDMLNELAFERYIGLDTETTGLDMFGHDHIVGLSLSLPEADLHYYIPYGHTTGEMQLPKYYVLEMCKPFIENKRLGKILHNAPFDAHMFKKEGITLNNIIMDTQIAMQVLNENEPTYALKPLATKYGKHFGFEDKSASFEELFGKGGFQDVPLNIGSIYACKDTHLLVKFYKWVLSFFEKQPQLKEVHDVEVETLQVAISMEQNGFAMDLEYAERYAEKLETEITEMEKELIEHFGDINVASPAQLSDKLFNDLELEDISGKGSVDKNVLKVLSKEHEGVQVLLDYRAQSKLLSTYIKPLPQMISPLDGRLHGKFNQTGTVTGRFSSNNPNLQNLPYEARKIIIAPKGKIIVGIDFSQIEPRFLAHTSQDPDFMKPYLTGQDLYSTLASKVFQKPIEECGDGSKWRKLMKVGLLAVMYGTSPYTLAQQLGITEDEAVEFIEDFLNNYPDVKAWIAETHDFVDENGYVQMAWGRKRRFIGHREVAKKYKAVRQRVINIIGEAPKNIWDEKYWKNKKLTYELKRSYHDLKKEYERVERQGVNAYIQGSSAIIMKKALIKTFNYCKLKGDDWKVLATIHDEILFEIPESATKEEIQGLENCMKTCVELSVPLKVDTEISYRWGEGMKLDEWLKYKEERENA
jgi:DNA polymerase I